MWQIVLIGVYCPFSFRNIAPWLAVIFKKNSHSATYFTLHSSKKNLPFKTWKYAQKQSPKKFQKLPNTNRTLKNDLKALKIFEIWFEPTTTRFFWVYLPLLLLLFSIPPFIICYFWSEKTFSVGEDRTAVQFTILFFLKWATLGLFFVYFRLFINTNYNSHNKYLWNNVMTIQYTTPGFEPMTFGIRVSSHNH